MAAECKKTAQENILKYRNLTKSVNNKEQKCRKCQIFNFLFEIRSQIHVHQLRKIRLDISNSDKVLAYRNAGKVNINEFYRKGATKNVEEIVEEFSLEIGFC